MEYGREKLSACANEAPHVPHKTSKSIRTSLNLFYRCVYIGNPYTQNVDAWWWSTCNVKMMSVWRGVRFLSSFGVFVPPLLLIMWDNLSVVLGTALLNPLWPLEKKISTLNPSSLPPKMCLQFTPRIYHTDHDLSDLSVDTWSSSSRAVVRGCAGSALYGRSNPGYMSYYYCRSCKSYGSHPATWTRSHRSYRSSIIYLPWKT